MAGYDERTREAETQRQRNNDTIRISIIKNGLMVTEGDTRETFCYQTRQEMHDHIDSFIDRRECEKQNEQGSYPSPHAASFSQNYDDRHARSRDRQTGQRHRPFNGSGGDVDKRSKDNRRIGVR